MATSDLIFDLLIATVVILKLLELFKISKLGKLQKQLDALQNSHSRLWQNHKEDRGNWNKTIDTIAMHEKRIFELEQKLANDSRKI
jgi:hypothetical protein